MSVTFCLKVSMLMLAMTSDNGDYIAAPVFCSHSVGSTLTSETVLHIKFLHNCGIANV